MSFHEYTDEEVRTFENLLSKQGKVKIVEKRAGFGPCLILRKCKYILNPLWDEGSSEPKYVHPVTICCILKHKVRPLRPNASSHLCGRGGKGKNRNRDVCISCEHIFPETHKINEERKHCHRALRKKKKVKGEVLKCSIHSPPCFIS